MTHEWLLFALYPLFFGNTNLFDSIPADEISDEIEENTRKVHEMIFRAVVRVVLTLLIFGGMLYYFNYMNIPESQEERIKRVIGAEKAKQSNGPPIPF